MAADLSFSLWRTSVCLPKFDEAVHLSDVESHNDPEEEPFRSHYKARDIWKQIEQELKEREPAMEESEQRCAVAIHSAINYMLGCNYIEAEETSVGEEKLVLSLQSIESEKMTPRYCCLAVKVLNMLGVLWSGRENYEKALQFAKGSEQLYSDYLASTEVAPFVIRDLFIDDEHLTPEEERQMAFESEHTHTLFYLAQIYDKLQKRSESAEYCYATLRRQLETRQFDSIEWALNCATLSQYYITVGDYMSTRHCLAAASKMVSQNDGCDQQDQSEKLLKCRADISRCWVKYCLNLLQESKSAIQSAENDTEITSSSETPMEASHEVAQFDLDVSAFEGDTPVSHVLTFEDARHVFILGQKHLDLARQFYVLDGYVTDYVSITQDYSQLFKNLAFFEHDIDRQCRMHKRRADMLLETAKQLNPQFYLVICRQLTFETAEIYNSLVELKYSSAEQREGPPTPHMIKKINQLVQQSIDQFQAFVDSFRDHKKEMPKTFEADSLHPVLVSKFYVARLYTKFIVSDKSQRVQNMKKALDLYQGLLDYSDAHPDMPPVFNEELSVCKEMVQLMPLKMTKIMQGP